MTITTASDWLADVTAFDGEWQGRAAGADNCVIAGRIEQPAAVSVSTSIPIRKSW